MVENISEFLGKWIYLLLPFASGLITSFVVEAINLTVKGTGRKWHPRWIVVIVSIIFGALLVFTFGEFYSGVLELSLAVLINVAVSIVFYKRAGSWTVDKFFSSYKARIDKRLK